ncbi:Carboxypeptidase regulatory-like domain-containing protein [Catalinimonas alkaloidigena]|uniref:Carboxypeptidase regulatory-like domain-containing protein n=1 Tax=Catalinimonas alkaloidigena TaxID=1075417 RepID=A0A1G9DM95_9BACT|nr:TonB-dependent receptor [Catalinimonas alkaloidigena]SDK65018.1 Carboxypeptidase regulatory-like domain-containing protein [Catalinimonas alkaloidigena]
MKKQLFILILICLGFGMGLPRGVWAQGVTTASISGTVADQTGESLPGATILARHQPTGTEYGTITDASGRFTLQNMRIGGPYLIQVSFVGYAPLEENNVNLSLGENRRFAFTLSEESTQLAEIVVTGQADDVFNSGRTGAGSNFSNEEITQLPTISRSLSDYTRLTPQAGANNTFGGRNAGYNNITINGALFNNVFGLAGTIGGQTNSEPISLDAIEEIQVNLSPYDVTQGTFTGAGINAVTRSGTNEFSGSLYYFTRNFGDSPFIGKKLDGSDSPLPSFTLNNKGFRVGGPILKNKLFFFVNGEMQRRGDPPSPNYVASRPGLSGSDVSAVSAADLDQLSTFLREKYGYDPGPYENYTLRSDSDKLTARLDFNVSKNHVLTLNYYYLKSYRDVNPSSSGALSNGRGPSNTNLPFLAAFYRINNNMNSIIGELNSNLGNKLSNKFQAGFTAMRDFRESSGGIFPLVDIGNGSGLQSTAFGYEPFSANNILNTNTFQISDNVTYFAGKHTLTLGTYNEFYKFENGFAPTYYGQFQFNTFEDFYNSANGVTNPDSISATNPNGYVSGPLRYQLRWSTNPDGSFPLVETKASQLAFYAQDEFQATPTLRITGGLRVDIPIINQEIARNESAAALSFRDGYQILTDRVQKSQLLWSPRLGFNWDVKGDKSTQIRGGTGIFTGRVPYVWISNQASNNGVLFGSLDARGTVDAPLYQYQFNPDVNAYIPPDRLPNSSYNLAVTDRNFKFPQVWRSNLAIDQRLPGGLAITVEGAITKDLNSVYHQNINLPESSLRLQGPDNRYIYYTVDSLGNPARANSRINSAVTDAILMRNTNKGYSWFTTVQVQKTFMSGFFASLAYTYTDSRSVNDGGSIAQSIWRDRQISGDPNDNAVSYSNFLRKHYVVGSVSYKKEYLNSMATTVSLVYTGAPGLSAPFGARYSYTYSRDLNGDGQTSNDLIYVPANQGEINLVDIRNSSGDVTYSAAQQWADLDAFISQDPYLQNRRGQYAERNGAQYPWQSQFDFRVLQDFYVNAGGKRNTLQLSLDIFNVANLLSSQWGLLRTPTRSGLIDFTGFDAEGNPTYQFPMLRGEPLRESFQVDPGLQSRWAMQVGLRYIFN